MVIDSIPPAITNFDSPSLTCLEASAMAVIPERQTLLLVVAGTDIGIPAALAACLAVICPSPAWMT